MLLASDNAILNPRVFVFRQNMPRDQLMRVRVGPFGNDPLRLAVGNARQGGNFSFGSVIQVD